MKTKSLVTLIIVFLLLIPLFYFAIAPYIGHMKADDEYSTIIQELSKATRGSECKSELSNGAGLGMWFEQNQELSCEIPAEYGQCTQVKETVRELFESIGFSTEPYTYDEYLITTKTSIGGVSDQACKNWERPEPNPQTGYVQISLQEKD